MNEFDHSDSNSESPDSILVEFTDSAIDPKQNGRHGMIPSPLVAHASNHNLLMLHLFFMNLRDSKRSH